MAAATPPYLVGQQITLVQFQIAAIDNSGNLTFPMTANNVATLVQSTGTLAAGTLAFSVGKLDEVSDFGGTVALENISPTNRGVAHNVFLTVGTNFSVSEIMGRGQGAVQLANVFWNGASKYAKFRYARGQELTEAMCVILSYDEDVAPGRSIARVSCGPVDAGSATWVVTRPYDNP